MKLENIDSLRNDRWHRNSRRRVRRPAVQNFIDVALAAHETRRVRTEREVGAHRANRRTVPDTESEPLYGVIEVLQISLAEAEADVFQIVIHVPEIVEQHTAQIVAEERKPELGGIVEQRISSDREAGN